MNIVNNAGFDYAEKNSLDNDYHHQKGEECVMEPCLWGFYGGWIFELQWGPLMVIFHHGDAVEDKGEEVRGDAIH